MVASTPEPRQATDTLLAGVRVLDLADEKGLFCGKLLGDLGADVIKVEPPGGDPARNKGPFYKDIVHHEKSLYWSALNTSKRGITLNLGTTSGRELLKRLAKTADFVLESFDPGYLDDLGIGYSVLERINPRLIMTSITPFGSTGPYAHYKGADLVLSAMAGYVYLCGEPDRPPCRISVPQAYLMGGLHGAMGSMIAHYHRQVTGEGQHLDVSIQEASTYLLLSTAEAWDVNRLIRRRSGANMVTRRPQPLGPLQSRNYWRCKDGYVIFSAQGGAFKGWVTSTTALIQWAHREGMAGGLENYDWRDHDTFRITQEQNEHIQDVIANFLLTKTRRELYEGGLKHSIMIGPMNHINEVLEDPQLQARKYFVPVEHPELGDTILYPGAPFRLSEAPWRISRRAPLIGEHNHEIYRGELDRTQEEMVALKAAGVI